MDGEGGPPSQGWSKFAKEFNFPSSSNTGGEAWKMPADLEKSVRDVEKQIAKEYKAIAAEKEELEKLDISVDMKQKWIKRKQNDIKINRASQRTLKEYILEEEKTLKGIDDMIEKKKKIGFMQKKQNFHLIIQISQIGLNYFQVLAQTSRDGLKVVIYLYSSYVCCIFFMQFNDNQGLL